MRRQLQIPEAESKAPQWCLGLPRTLSQTSSAHGTVPHVQTTRMASTSATSHGSAPEREDVPWPKRWSKTKRQWQKLLEGRFRAAPHKLQSHEDSQNLPSLYKHLTPSLTGGGRHWCRDFPLKLARETLTVSENLILACTAQVPQYISGSRHSQKHDPVFFLPFLFLDHTTRITGSQLPTRSQTWAWQWKHKALTTGPPGIPNGLLFLNHSFPHGREAWIRTHRLVLLPGEVLSASVLKLVWRGGLLWLSLVCMGFRVCTSTDPITLLDPPNCEWLFFIVRLIMFPLWQAIVISFNFLSGYWL